MGWKETTVVTSRQGGVAENQWVVSDHLSSAKVDACKCAEDSKRESQAAFSFNSKLSRFLNQSVIQRYSIQEVLEDSHMKKSNKEAGKLCGPKQEAGDQKAGHQMRTMEET